FFFFSYHSAQLFLHSFPTRRSSDLVPSMVITDFGISSDKNPDGSEGRAFYLWKKDNPPGKAAATQYFCSTVVKNGVVALSIMLIDRKSTRLNSSHQIISYAVFCLKK